MNSQCIMQAIHELKRFGVDPAEVIMHPDDVDELAKEFADFARPNKAKVLPQIWGVPLNIRPDAKKGTVVVRGKT